MVLTEYNWAFVVAGLFALFEFFKWAVTGLEWICKKFGIETKGMRQKREWNDRLTKTERDIEQIKANSDRNVDMFLDHERQVVDKFMDIKAEIVRELNKLHDKIDDQRAQMDATNEANDKTDCAILRDRITGGMRFFSQNRDEEGNVHISFTDHENMEALFQEYFAKHGNGTTHQMYENEFKYFIIDR